MTGGPRHQRARNGLKAMGGKYNSNAINEEWDGIESNSTTIKFWIKSNKQTNNQKNVKFDGKIRTNDQVHT